MNESDQDEMIKFLLKQIQKREAGNAELRSKIEAFEEQIENLENLQGRNDVSLSLSQFKRHKTIDQLLSELSVDPRSRYINPKTKRLIDKATDLIFEYCESDPRLAPRHNWRNN